MDLLASVTLRYSRAYFVAFAVLLFALLGLTSVAVLRGTYATRTLAYIQTAEKIVNALPVSDFSHVMPHDTPDTNPFHARIRDTLMRAALETDVRAATLVYESDGHLRVLASTDDGFAPATRAPLGGALTTEAYTSALNGASGFVGETGAARGTVAALVPVRDTNGTVRAVLLVEHAARGFTRALLLAALLPFFTLAIAYGLLALIYFWFRDRERLLSARQEQIELFARDLYSPLLGARWAAEQLASHKSTRVTARELASALNLLTDWSRELHDITRFDTARAKMMHRESVQLAPLVVHTIAAHELFARSRDVQFVSEQIPARAMATVYPELLRRALLAVCSYALASTSLGGVIRILYTSEHDTHFLSFVLPSIVSETPHPLVLADRALAAMGGALTIQRDESSFTLTLAIPG